MQTTAVPEQENYPLILVADDDPTVVELVRMRLRRAGYRTIPAADGLAALRAIGSERPDLVLLDIGMPNLDGKGVCRVVQAMGAEGPAIIFLTAQSSVAERIEGLDLGAFDYVTKPFDPSELLARVEVALRMRSRDRAA